MMYSWILAFERYSFNNNEGICHYEKQHRIAVKSWIFLLPSIMIKATDDYKRKLMLTSVGDGEKNIFLWVRIFFIVNSWIKISNNDKPAEELIQTTQTS